MKSSNLHQKNVQVFNFFKKYSSNTLQLFQEIFNLPRISLRVLGLFFSLLPKYITEQRGTNVFFIHHLTRFEKTNIHTGVRNESGEKYSDSFAYCLIELVQVVYILSSKVHLVALSDQGLFFLLLTSCLDMER